MEYFKTGIDGLDYLFGCRGNKNSINEQNKNNHKLRLNNDNNLLIVLRGARGISKTNLAMCIMEGVSNQLRERCNFYSINKSSLELQQQCKEMFGEHSQESLKNVFPEIINNVCNSYISPNLVRFTSITQNISELDNDNKASCIVVDGFAGLNTDEFDKIPLLALEEKLRKKAKVGILVFDDRLTNTSTNADIIIEMRRSCDTRHNYTFFELQIAKSTLQPSAYGWHKYKCLNNGKIEVHPSVHRVLSEMQPLREQVQMIISEEQKYNPSELDFSEKGELILSNILSPKCGEIVSVVGDTNTFKRYLTALSVSKSLSRNNRCLVILFNESKKGFMGILNNLNPQALSNNKLQFFEMPMGCISPDEFINMTRQYISYFAENSDEKNVSIFLLDMLELDLSFPMLQAETLFIPALASVCKQHKNKENSPDVSLHIVCNKKFSLLDTVISVSDNVLVTKRDNNDDVNRLTIYLEKKSLGYEHNSRVYRFDIDNAHTMFKDLDNTPCTEISSTKDFWRQSINVKNSVSVKSEKAL